MHQDGRRRISTSMLRAGRTDVSARLAARVTGEGGTFG
jgi:hypothetical protein